VRRDQHITLIIPALNEESAIREVLNTLPSWVDDVVVADNASTDSTAGVAKELGARVVTTTTRGYGSNCLGAIATVTSTDILAFMDGDASCDGTELASLIDPIATDTADVVIGSRTLGEIEPDAMGLAQRAGNWLAPALIRLFWKVPVTDLGPYRAIRFSSYRQLDMQDPAYGWTVELQLKAIEAKLRMIEIPVRCRARIGESKISGTWRGVLGASTAILGMIVRYAIGLR